ncbi:uncharacterized protein MONBRDRAFT_11449 [Monosiga brevicollis MX1]|uniref:Acyltransferase n=1 Tax=Monosiga brevicollis TaxID=81824 RepID=A9V9J5_MONBE|nr:uncharacterized protein MONBRDRAFT_11449 [Monosiga brevicollis MX1]EDQ85806.1 predicted protein [Monosiga brevicollis MX1]|eukprot:XP_001749285.1 hypothetical protein [Monosiga brevicollis MX1]
MADDAPTTLFSDLEDVPESPRVTRRTILRKRSTKSTSSSAPATPRTPAVREHEDRDAAPPAVGSLASGLWHILSLNSFLVAVGFVLFLIAEFGTDSPGLEDTLAMMGLLSAATGIVITYTRGGSQAHTNWTHFQPLQGGVRFVALQISAWTLFFFFLAAPIMPFGLALLYPSLALRGLKLGAGVLALLTQIVMIASLLTYYKPGTEPSSTGSQEPGHSIHRDVIAFLQSVQGHRWWLSFMGLQVLLATSGLGVAVMAEAYEGTSAAVLVFIAFCCFSFALFLTYGIGGLWKHHKRQWTFYQPFVGGAVFVLLQVIYDGRTPLSRADRHIFGFSPHGIFPITAAYGTRSRAVTLAGFRAGLRRKGSVLLVPGGQLEMLFSDSRKKDIYIDSSHKGFIKIALREKSKDPLRRHYLVPVYSFGEPAVLDNIRTPLWLQRWVTKTFGANVIFVPYGAYGLPGVPRPAKVTLLVGEAVEVPYVARPSARHVDLLQQRYLHSLQTAFERHKRQVQGHHQDDRLEIQPPVCLLSPEDFDAAWKVLEREVITQEARNKPQRTSTLEFTWMGLLLSVLFWTVVLLAYGPAFTPDVVGSNLTVAE